MEFVVVERTYDPGKTQEEIDEMMSASSPCYELRRVKHVLTVISLDGRRALCMYDAPDAASVRDANDENGDPYDRIWTGVRLARPGT